MYFQLYSSIFFVLLKTKHVLSAEWKSQILVDRRKMEVATGQGREGHPREAAVSACNLEMWSL